MPDQQNRPAPLREEMIKRLEAICGPEAVSTDIIDLISSARGTWPVELKWVRQGPYRYLPQAVVWPHTTEEAAQVLALATEHRVTVTPFGGGSGIVGGSICEHGGIVVDTKRMLSLRVVDEDMIAHVGAGWTAYSLEETLNDQGYTLGQFPQSMLSSTVGGWIATRAVGTFSGRYGKIDDAVIGLTVALPTGDIYRSHLAPKSSAGPNLDELFLGSEGAYGIVTEAAFRIYELPDKRLWKSYLFPSTQHGLQAIRQFLRKGCSPALVRLYDEHEAAPRLKRRGYSEGDALLILGMEGLEQQVNLDDAITRAICLQNDGREEGSHFAEDWFRDRFNTSGMLRYVQKPGGIADALEVSAPWSKLADVYENMRRALVPLCDEIHTHFSHFYPTGGMAYVIFHAQAENDLAAESLYYDIVEAAMNACVEAGGSISHHHGVGRAKAAWMVHEHNAGFHVMEKIKKALDPANILNPGVLGLGVDKPSAIPSVTALTPIRRKEDASGD